MNKWVSIIFIILVTLATVGLMMIQVYWIRDAVKLKQAIFAKDVRESISDVIFEVDKIRLEERIKKQRKFYEENQGSFQLYDSLNQVLYYNFKNIDSQTDIDKFMQSSNMAGKVLSDLTFNYNQQEPGNFFYKKKNLINTLITQALKKKDIITKFEFGIFSPATNSLILQKTGTYPDALLNESLVFDLTPLG